jgi:hypothetical protein
MLCHAMRDGFTDAFGGAGDNGDFAAEIEKLHANTPCAEGLYIAAF